MTKKRRRGYRLPQYYEGSDGGGGSQQLQIRSDDDEIQEEVLDDETQVMGDDDTQIAVDDHGCPLINVFPDPEAAASVQSTEDKETESKTEENAEGKNAKAPDGQVEDDIIKATHDVATPLQGARDAEQAESKEQVEDAAVHRNEDTWEVMWTEEESKSRQSPLPFVRQGDPDAEHARIRDKLLLTYTCCRRADA